MKPNRTGLCGRRRGLTLVEMLVAMTITLLMVYGMVLAFEKIGNEVIDGRAVIEMANQSRAVSQRLRQDLGGVTLPVRPWISAEPPQGYFEYVDGPASDDPTTPGRLSMVGDLDDVLMFTSRSLNDPFVGEIGVAPFAAVLKSELAEIVWFTRWIDSPNKNVVGQVDPNEVSLHRRAMLIRPDLGRDQWWTQVPIVNNPFQDLCRATFRFTGPAPQPYQIPNDLLELRAAMLSFNQNCDISVRWQVVLGGGSVICLPIPNSLSDLGKRENRYCHFPVLYTDPTNPAMVQCLPERVASGAAWPADYPLPVYPFGVVHEQFGTPAGRIAAANTVPSLTTFMMSDGKTGQDLMMQNMLAFDVRAFDALAPVSADAALGVAARALGPSDPGYLAGPPLGQGEYVDLGYRWRPATPLAVESQFSDVPLYGNLSSSVSPAFPDVYPGGFPAPFAGRPRTFSQFTYDTLTMQYESDGTSPPILGLPPAIAVAMADQDGDGVVDEMTNGWDDDGNLAIDDDGEREAPSPYGDPLRGVKVILRFNESDTRQVRQVSIVSNFVPD